MTGGAPARGGTGPIDPTPIVAALETLRRDGATAQAVAAFEAALDGFTRAAAGLAQDGPDAVAQRIARKRVLAETLATEVLPRLARDVRDEAPAADGSARGARGHLIALAELLVRLRERAGPAARSGIAGEAWRDLERDLAGRAAALFEAAKAGLDRDDHPDLAAVARQIQRLGILQWAVETLGFPATVRMVRQSSRILGRLAMRRATEVVETFLDDRTLEHRVDAANVTVCIDDLVVVLTRILDGELEERAEGPQLFAESIGSDVMERFLTALRRLAMLSIAEARRTVEAEDAGVRTLDGALRQIGAIVRLCARLRHPLATRDLARLDSEARRAARRLCADVIEMAARETEPRRARRLAAQAASAERFLADIGRSVTGRG